MPSGEQSFALGSLHHRLEHVPTFHEPEHFIRRLPDSHGEAREHCRAHLASFRGHLHADGYSGFQELYESAQGMPAAVTEVACWAHARRYFFDVHHKNGSPIAKQALDQIGALFDVERLIAGQMPEQRRRIRRFCYAPSAPERLPRASSRPPPDTR